MTDVETFRALARSSPWLWSSVKLTRTTTGGENDERVRAWIRRPGLMRVEPDDGEARVIDESRDVGRGGVLYSDVGRGRAWYRDAGASRLRFSLARLFGRSGYVSLAVAPMPGVAGPGVAGPDDDAPGPHTVEPEFRNPQHPQAPQPTRRDDGLVRQRPDDFSLMYDDPMYENYQWVAMLDPVELADGRRPDDPAEKADAGDPAEKADGVDPDRPPDVGSVPPRGVEVMKLTETKHHGRRALAATVRPTPQYNPRCTCCALLYNDITVELLREEGVPPPEPPPVFAEAHRVVLDRQTGICVSLRDVGGDRDGVGFDVVIEEVDADYPDEMFR